MIFRQNVLILLFFTVFSNLKGEVKIDVHLKIPGEGKIQLFGFEDYISNKKILIKEYTVGNKKDFKFQVNCDELSAFVVKFRNYECQFYVLPNEKYEIELNLPDNPIRHQFESKSIYPYFLKQDKNSFNIKWANLQWEVDSVRSEFVKKYKFMIPMNALDSALSNIHFLKAENKWLEGLADYLEFEVKYSVSRKPLDIGVEYLMTNTSAIVKGDLLASEGLSLFASDFYGYLNEKEKTIVLDEVNTVGPLSEYLRIIQGKTNISDTNFLYLLLFKCLYANAFQKGFNRVSIINHLQSVKSNTKYCNTVATNLAESLNKLQVGSPFFSGEIILENDTINLFKLSSNPIYLNFWNEKCNDCKIDMNIISELVSQYKNINFVSIYLGDAGSEHFQYQPSNTANNWHRSYAFDYWSFIDAYDVKALPLYYLILPGGEIYKSPARGPYHRTLDVINKLNTASKKHPDYLDVRDYDE